MDCASAHQLLSQRNSAHIRHADLEAVFAGVAGARHDARDACKVGRGKVAKHKLAQVQLGQPLESDAAPREIDAAVSMRMRLLSAAMQC